MYWKHQYGNERLDAHRPGGVREDLGPVQGTWSPVDKGADSSQVDNSIQDAVEIFGLENLMPILNAAGYKASRAEQVLIMLHIRKGFRLPFPTMKVPNSTSEMSVGPETVKILVEEYRKDIMWGFCRGRDVSVEEETLASLEEFLTFAKR